MKRNHLFLLAATILLVVLLLAKCNCRNPTTTATRFVQPPIPTADVPFKEYTVEAAKGDTLLYPSGTVVLFPPHAFVDKSGQPIEGMVQIKYREFADPVDFFLSGIPMGYDSAGVHYTFESAGMCDIQAFQNGQPVFVNKKAKPEINIATRNTDLAQNLYYLDTATKQWVNRGKSSILTVGQSQASVKQADVATISEPVKPFRANEDLPIIKVTIDPESFKELMVYDNLQFQLDKNEKRFKPEDSYIRWDDIKLQKGKGSGLYTIRFSKSFADYHKSVEYKVRPVLNENDYAKAMIVYDRQMKAYEQQIEARLAADKANKAAYIKDSLNNAQIDRDNEKTAQLNAIIEAKNAEMEAANQQIEKENKEVKSINLANRSLRNFEIDGFGIWNCDRPLGGEVYVNVIPSFVDEHQQPIQPMDVNLFIRQFNGLYQVRNNFIPIPISRENMMVGVVDGYFAYITYEEFKNLGITANTQKQTFPMHIVSKANNNYDFIKSLVSQ